MPGRDPERWKFDAGGHLVCRALTSCLGPLCHEYDHIIPYSQGGPTSVENCQILSTRINRQKSDKVVDGASHGGDAEKELNGMAFKYEFSMEELDLVEMACYGSVRRFVAEQTFTFCECATTNDALKEFKQACERPQYEKKTPVIKL